MNVYLGQAFLVLPLAAGVIKKFRSQTIFHIHITKKKDM